MKIYFFIVFITCFSNLNTVYANSNKTKCLISLHGLARKSSSMNKIVREFKNKNYKVWNETYPSTEKKIEDLSTYVKKGLDFCNTNNTNEVYFVTHSMGGILVRHYFQNFNDKNILSKIKAVVMLAPPNHGSEIVDAFKTKSWFKWFNGPAGQQLGTDQNSLPNQLKRIPLNIGVIIGNSTSDPWFSYLFSGPNDGKVSVESAKLKEMKDFLVVPHGHTFIMDSDIVIKNIFNFFEYGSFIK